jgi:hypothetical protein
MSINLTLKALIISLSIAVIWLLISNQNTKKLLDESYSNHATTLEHVIAAQMALNDGRLEALPLASKSLNKAVSIAAIRFAKKRVFNGYVMFIIELKDEEILQSNELSDQEKSIFKKYLDETRSR